MEQTTEHIIKHSLDSSRILKDIIENRYSDLRFTNGSFCIEKRPYYCDRGTFSVKILVDMHQDKLFIDACDMFPRYYFGLHTMLSELEEWMKKNKQEVIE